MRARLLLPIAILATVLIAGCGSDNGDETTQTSGSSSATTSATPPPSAPAGASAQACTIDTAGLEDLRVTGVDCGAGQQVAVAWTRGTTCASPQSSSRFACSVRGYRCLGTTTERGVAVSCARSGRSIAFVAKR
jgi:hypothetical protein